MVCPWDRMGMWLEGGRCCSWEREGQSCVISLGKYGLEGICRLHPVFISWGCWNKWSQSWRLNNRNLFSHSFGGRKSEIKVSLYGGLGENVFLASSKSRWLLAVLGGGCIRLGSVFAVCPSSLCLLLLRIMVMAFRGFLNNLGCSLHFKILYLITITETFFSLNNMMTFTDYRDLMWYLLRGVYQPTTSIRSLFPLLPFDLIKISFFVYTQAMHVLCMLHSLTKDASHLTPLAWNRHIGISAHWGPRRGSALSGLLGKCLLILWKIPKSESPCLPLATVSWRCKARTHSHHALIWRTEQIGKGG